MQVIGNNVANASTTGYKQSRAEFTDIFATSNLGVTANAMLMLSALWQQTSNFKTRHGVWSNVDEVRHERSN